MVAHRSGVHPKALSGLALAQIEQFLERLQKLWCLRLILVGKYDAPAGLGQVFGIDAFFEAELARSELLIPPF